MKFKWIRDFEKVFIVHIAVAFWWVLCWFGMTFIIKMWINLPTNNIFVNFFGLVALVGYVAIMGHGIVILVIGLSKDLIKRWKTGES